jgi:pSer/pThr/pTyr-binding forkhead associated (FHA) protein
MFVNRPIEPLMEAPMEYTITGISPDRLEEKVALYKKLTAQRDQLLARLDNVEQQKSSVAKRIYEKVKFEYTGELKNVRSQLSPIESELSEAKREGEKELASLNDKIREMEEEMTEAEFRHRVGEFDSDKLVEIREKINPELTDKSERQNEVSNRLKTIGSFENTLDLDKDTGETLEDDADDDEDAVEDRGKNGDEDEKDSDETEESIDSEGTSPTEEPSETEAPSYDDDEADKDAASFENPQDWIDEFGEEKRATLRAESSGGGKSKSEDFTDTLTESTQSVSASDSTDSANDDPLSALADPSDERRETETPEATTATKTIDRETATSTGFPNLVIITGPSSGRKVPLLPMTMSIGREHDNNIELKDPEVARYHARVLFENGRFILEDLESSNGTWLNGEQTKQSALVNGDRIKIGDTEMAIDFD